MSGWGDPPRRLSAAAHRGDSDFGGQGVFVLALVALSVFATIGSLSVRQITAPATALPILEAVIATLSDVDQYLADERPALEAQLAKPANETAALPGFPVYVLITDQDLAGGPAGLRDAVLSRAAAQVYDQGSGAFDQTGSQSIQLLSGDIGVRLVVDWMNADAHRLAGWCAMIASATLAASAALSVLRRRSISGALGAAVLIGAIPGTALAALVWALAGLYGPGSDPFAADVREILRAEAGLLLRNFAVAVGAGVLLVLVGLAFELAERTRFSSGERPTGLQPAARRNGEDGTGF